MALEVDKDSWIDGCVVGIREIVKSQLPLWINSRDEIIAQLPVREMAADLFKKNYPRHP